jgi:hypothetical protein
MHIYIKFNLFRGKTSTKFDQEADVDCGEKL